MPTHIYSYVAMNSKTPQLAASAKTLYGRLLPAGIFLLQRKRLMKMMETILSLCISTDPFFPHISHNDLLNYMLADPPWIHCRSGFYNCGDRRKWTERKQDNCIMIRHLNTQKSTWSIRSAMTMSAICELFILFQFLKASWSFVTHYLHWCYLFYLSISTPSWPTLTQHLFKDMKHVPNPSYLQRLGTSHLGTY